MLEVSNGWAYGLWLGPRQATSLLDHGCGHHLQESTKAAAKGMEDITQTEYLSPSSYCPYSSFL